MGHPIERQNNGGNHEDGQAEKCRAFKNTHLSCPARRYRRNFRGGSGCRGRLGGRERQRWSCLRRRHLRHRSNEAIAAAAYSLNVPWVTGGIAQSLAKFVDGCADAAFKINKSIRRP